MNENMAWIANRNYSFTQDWVIRPCPNFNGGSRVQLTGGKIKVDTENNTLIKQYDGELSVVDYFPYKSAHYDINYFGQFSQHHAYGYSCRQILAEFEG